jgi:hypothetical protein
MSTQNQFEFEHGGKTYIVPDRHYLTRSAFVKPKIARREIQQKDIKHEDILKIADRDNPHSKWAVVSIAGDSFQNMMVLKTNGVTLHTHYFFKKNLLSLFQDKSLRIFRLNHEGVFSDKIEIRYKFVYPTFKDDAGQEWGIVDLDGAIKAGLIEVVKPKMRKIDNRDFAPGDLMRYTGIYNRGNGIFQRIDPIDLNPDQGDKSYIRLTGEGYAGGVGSTPTFAMCISGCIYEKWDAAAGKWISEVPDV